MIKTILLTFTTCFALASATDSLRTEVIDGKTYIIHRVEQKETLFAISKKYGVALITVVESNPNASSGLEPGQLIKVPYSANNRTKTKEGTIHKVGQKETLYSISKQYSVTVDEIKMWNNLTSNNLKLGQELLIKDKVPEKKEVNTHTVTAEETMYSISRKYSITVQQIKDWNQLTSSELKPGQIIFISGPMAQGNSSKDSNTTVDSNNNSNSAGVVSTASVSSANVIPVTESVVGSDEVHETGMALLLDGTEGNRKYLAHHRTVKPGTIIRVKNNAQRKEVFVRVIGNLSSAESSDVVLRISKSAFDKLGGDGKFQVEITYFK